MGKEKKLNLSPKEEEMICEKLEKVSGLRSEYEKIHPYFYKDDSTTIPGIKDIKTPVISNNSFELLCQALEHLCAYYEEQIEIEW